MKKSYRILAVSMLAGSLMLSACSSKTAATKGKMNRAVPVVTTTVHSALVGGNSALTGQINASLQTKVVSKLSGKVAQVFVQTGDWVKAGDPLVQIDTTDLNAQLQQQQAALQVAQAQLAKSKNDAKNSATQSNISLQQAKTALDASQAKYNRVLSLFNAGAETQQDLDNAKQDLTTNQEKYNSALQSYNAVDLGGNPLNQDSVKVSESQVEQARANIAVLENQISEATVTSPVSGVVASRDVEVGGFAGSQSSVVTIVQTNPVKVNLNVPEDLISQIKVGQAVKVGVQDDKNKSLDAKISRISPVLDNNAKSYPVEVDLANPDGSLKPGMVAQVTITGLPTHKGILIPASALVQTPDGPKVFTVQNNIAHQHLIKLGQIGTDQVEVLSGINEGDVLVTTGEELLSEGAEVTAASNGVTTDTKGGKANGNLGKGKGHGGNPSASSGGQQ
jgi:HlyD family secretion protein